MKNVASNYVDDDYGEGEGWQDGMGTIASRDAAPQAALRAVDLLRCAHPSADMDRFDDDADAPTRSEAHLRMVASLQKGFQVYAAAASKRRCGGASARAAGAPPVAVGDSRPGDDAASHAASTLLSAPPASEHGSDGNDEHMREFLHNLLGCFVLRRTKDAVNLGLPLKTRELAWAPMTRTQAAIARTLHAATILATDPHGLLGASVRRVVAEDPSLAAVPCAAGHESTPPFGFVGGLATVFSALQDAAPAPLPAGASASPAAAVAGHEGAGSSGGVHSSAPAAAAQPTTGDSSRLAMLLRKVANHPLLLRSRYGNAAVLHIARALWEADTPTAGGAAGDWESRQALLSHDAALLPPLEPSVLIVPRLEHDAGDAALALPGDCGGVNGSGLLQSEVHSLAAAHYAPCQAELLSWAAIHTGVRLDPASDAVVEPAREEAEKSDPRCDAGKPAAPLAKRLRPTREAAALTHSTTGSATERRDAIKRVHALADFAERLLRSSVSKARTRTHGRARTETARGCPA